ncbi:MAG: hypothetical protein DCF25_17575 [Leptolyngbya foveolarum]|uniref:Uncharacterized protein n=1 Tax=Leptolyngbya foveolarum TaxID=47253 RepID=A0A2W4VJU3_9CYAN|nr:MAG: hypothetical protein DCF25_17575 [Leptolyngbya foveolarum]
MTNKPVEATHPLTHDLAMQIQQQMALKSTLSDFALDAEGDIATALESFSAQHSSRWAKPSLSGLNRSELAVDMFITQGAIAGSPAINLFTQTQDLSNKQQSWLKQWQRSFNGLFAIKSVDLDSKPNRYEMVNWLTEKVYSVRANSELVAAVAARLEVGEIVLARLLPVAEGEWTFSGPMTLLGKLGNPKLAVAIGNFRQWFPQQLYGDAPELQEAAWESVKRQYDDFLAFFGAEKVTLSGYELTKKLQAYQEAATEKSLSEAGIDRNRSLKALVKESGVSEEDIDEALSAVGEESKAAKMLLESDQSLQMVTPKIKLPDELQRAEAVTVLIHPRWGETFLTDYSRLEAWLEKSPLSEEEGALIDRLVLKYLQDDKVILPVWQRLASEHGVALEAALRRVLNQPEFDIEQDLLGAIARHGKSLTPQMPESASVPEHLDRLFKSVLTFLGKDADGKRSGKKRAQKKKSGFGK